MLRTGWKLCGLAFQARLEAPPVSRRGMVMLMMTVNLMRPGAAKKSIVCVCDKA